MTRRLFFGWKVVAAAFIIAVFAWGNGFYGMSVFLNVLRQQRGWPVSIVSAAITAHYVLSAILVANLAEAHRRFGLAAVTQAGIAATGVGLLLWALAEAPWELFGAALFTGAGWASTSGAAINAMVAPWFNRRRAAALSHAMNGSSVGGIVFTPVWVALIAHFGFSTAALLVASVMLALLWPLVTHYLAVTPEAVGTTPDGEPQADRSDRRPEARPTPRSVLLRERRFVTLSAAFALALFAQIGLIVHLLARLVPVMGSTSAAACVSLVTASAIAGRSLLGLLIGQADRRLVAAGIFVMQAAGVLCLAFGENSDALLAGCVLFGLGVGNLISLPPLIVQQEFDPADALRVVALVTAINQAVFAFAPMILGVLTRMSGGYTMPFLVAALIQVLAAIVAANGRWVRDAATSSQ